MREQDLILNSEASLLVAKQLRDQRQVERLPCIGGAIEQFGDQLAPQRAQILSVKRHLGQLRHADAIRASVACSIGQIEKPSLHVKSPQSACTSHAASAVGAWPNCEAMSP
jgi:hypothetical protein